MQKNISVLLVDDHAVVRTGYKTYLSLIDNIGTIYEAERGEAACQIYSRYAPDVVIMDLSMPGIGGFETIRRLLNRDAQCRILVFSIHKELVYVNRAIKAGAKGYIGKNSAPETLVAAVHQIAVGRTYLDPDIAQQLAISSVRGENNVGALASLTPREFDVFCLLAKGYTPRRAADELHLSHKTVCNYSTAVKAKLEVESVAELTMLATLSGIIGNVNEEGIQ
ncbi:MAG: response regulator [Gammaproteobacteria bacterium]